MPVSISPPCFPGLEIGNLLAGEARKTRGEVEGPQPMCRLHPLLLGPMVHGPPAPQKQRCPTLPHGTDPLRGLWSSQAFGNAKLENTSLGLRLQPLLRHERLTGVFLPFHTLLGYFGQVFFVLVGSSGSDFGAINEGHKEKLDFAEKLGEGGATAQTQPLSLPSDWGGFPIHI